ncbi:acetyl-CoA C-acetyltransferase [Bacillus sp. FJAT-44742]|uniref:acetyl-CoA C-acetyltransferase n=1 Tax=Bacillus sp. FJAT-44742 TaxID=2014005 RepID=UPI000C2339DF|nr:acetyl-CoA C-acetyltransferase [Bacillus sp. FJAT-44742]
MKDVFLLEGARTPFGSFGGSLKNTGPLTLGVTAAKEAVRRSGVTAEEVDISVIGNVIPSEKNAAYLSRHIALHTGVPITSPALTVNRLCGSGLQSVISVAQSLTLDEGRVGLAGGTENMSMSPYALRKSRFGTGLKSPQMDDMLWETLTDEYCGCGMGITAENLAKKYEITRNEQDEYAYLSHQRAAKAIEGVFTQEITPVELKSKKGTKMIELDEHIRKDLTLDNLEGLKPAFQAEGTVTAGNASGINDGAAAVILAGEDYVNQRQEKPLARIVSWSVAGVEPDIMGIGPVPAIRKALERASLSIEDMDLVEVNEAFASQYVAVEKELGLNREKTNVNGGAIALGHPVGASGTRVLYSLALELRNRKAKYGVASLCIGGGQGIAVILESL